jgi:mannose-6-phosphate isomerase-like protein (cupin superfamily)
MPDYTLKNLKADVKDMAPEFGMSPPLEARFAQGSLELEKSGLSYQRLVANGRVPFGHRHAKQEEVYVVLSGSGRLKLDDEIVDVQTWDAIRVGPETERAFEGGPDGIEFLAFGAPFEGKNDAEMLDDWWTD